MNDEEPRRWRGQKMILRQAQDSNAAGLIIIFLLS